MNSDGPDVSPNEEAEAAMEAEEEGVLGTPWTRRTFLKAAALGTVAAAVFNKGPGASFGPAAAWANDLSNSPCTAQDTFLVGSGLVVNEPCVCTGTFNAVVAFELHNGTGTNRYCLALHIPAGSGIPAGDYILNTEDDGSGTSTLPPGTHTMFGFFPNFPCNTGGTAVCVGPLDSSGNPTVVRGKCDAGTCATLAWSTSPNAAGCTTADQSPPGGQCRHQGICIQGFGITATCADGSCNARSLTNNCCSVNCGASLNVKITVSGQSGTPCASPPTVSVKRPGATTFTNVTLNSSGCYVDSSPVQGTYTFRATDCHGCTRDTTLAVCVAQPTIGAPSLVANPCDGKAKFRAGTVTGGTAPFTFKFSLDGGADVNGTGTNGDEFVYSPSLVSGGLDTSCHSLVAKVTDANGCTATSSATTFSQCVSTTTGCTVS